MRFFSVLALCFVLGWPGMLLGVGDVLVVNSIIQDGVSAVSVIAGLMLAIVHFLHIGIFFKNWGPAEAGLGPAMFGLTNGLTWFISMVVTIVTLCLI